MRHFGWCVAIFTILATATSFSGCGSTSEDPGVVQVEWRVEGTTCQKAGIETVRLNLFQDSELMVSQDGICSAGSLTMPEVETGRYDLVLSGLDSDELAIYEATHPGLKVKEGTTPSTPGEDLVLRLKLGTVQMRWTLPSDNPLCGFNDVSQVEVNIAQASSMLNLFSGIFPCDPGSTSNDALPAPLIDGWIVISDILPADVEILLYGLDSDGERNFKGEESASISIGGSLQLKVALEPCSGNCI